MTMVPKSGMRESRIGPDTFRDEYVVDVPVDGYGGPSTYLSMFRIICSNGAVARVPEFRSDIVTGKDEPVHALSRALDTFSNDEGFSALRERYESAQRSPASVRECLSIQTLEAWIGSILREEYDLEGVSPRGKEFQGMFGAKSPAGFAKA
jgi:hypothetical protein